MSRLKRLIQEIHRRSLWQVLGIYLVGAWVAFQGIEALVSGLGLPEWVPGLTVAILIAGLPIVLDYRVSTRNASPIGDVRFEERYRLKLTSLAPRT